MILIYSLFGLAADRVEPDRTIDALIHNVAAQQHTDGSWGSFGIMRPPTADSSISITVLAIRVLRDYAPPARKAEFDERIAKAAKWLLKAEPATTEDSVMQPLGAKWAGLSGARIERPAKRVLPLQREDGGWAQTPYLKSEAYATATALFALEEAAVSGADAVYGKGVAYLLSTQAEDGSWYVARRAPKFQPYFEGGFPYGHDRWISQMSDRISNRRAELRATGESRREVDIYPRRTCFRHITPNSSMARGLRRPSSIRTISTSAQAK